MQREIHLPDTGHSLTLSFERPRCLLYSGDDLGAYTSSSCCVIKIDGSAVSRSKWQSFHWMYKCKHQKKTICQVKGKGQNCTPWTAPMTYCFVLSHH